MRLALALLITLSLTACGAAATPAQNGAATSAATSVATPAPATEVATTPASAATEAPTTTATGVSAAPAGATLEAGSVEAKAAEVLSRRVGTDLSKLTLTAKDEQEWPNPGLGCPKEGVMYTQVITPGFKLTYTDGAKTYEVHTDQSGARAVLCENNQPVELTNAGG